MINRRKIEAYIPIQRTDQTIIRYIKQQMRPQVQEYDGNIKLVPLVYNGAERWVQVRQRNYLVDENGNTLYPLISFSRTSTKISQNKTVNKIWTYGYRNFVQIQNKYSSTRPFNSVDKNYGSLSKTSYFNLMLPIPITCNYEFQVYTDGQQHMNQILQTFFLHDRRWWIVDGYRVKIRFSDFSNTTQIQAQKQRLVKSTFSLTTQSTLFPKAPQPVFTVQQKENIKKIESIL